MPSENWRSRSLSGPSTPQLSGATTFQFWCSVGDGPTAPSGVHPRYRTRHHNNTMGGQGGTNDQPFARNSRVASSMVVVLVKLPPFWRNDPQLWFTQVEAKFDPRSIITESTRFIYIVRCWSPKYAMEGERHFAATSDEQHLHNFEGHVHKAL